MKRIPYISVIDNSNFRNLWLGQIISQIAQNMLYFILVVRVYQTTQSNFAVSMLILSFGIPAILFGIIAGGIVDNYDKRDVLVICNLLRILIFLGFFIFPDNLILMYLFTVLFSVVTQMFIPAEAPSIPELVPSDNLLAANSLFTISFYGSMVLGFISSGPFLKTFGSPIIYLFMAFLMFLALVFVYNIPKIAKNKKNSQLNLKLVGKTIKDGLKFIEENKRIKQALVLLTFAQALIMTLSVLAPGFADKILMIDLTDTSFLVMGPAGLGLIIGAFLVGSIGKKYLKSILILWGIISTGIVLLLLSLISFKIFSISQYSIVLFSLLLIFMIGLFNSFITVPASTILQEDTDGDMRSRVYGVLTSVSGGISVLPVIFSGILADIMGTGKTMLIIGISVLAIGIYKYHEKNKGILNLQKI